MKIDKLRIMLVGIIVLISACTDPYSSSDKVCSASHSVADKKYTGHGVSDSEEIAREKALEDWAEKCRRGGSAGCEKAKNSAYTDCDTLGDSWETSTQ